MATAAPADLGFNFEHTYTQLPTTFYSDATPARISAPKAVVVNHRLADELGLNTDSADSDALSQLFGGQQVPENARPIAQAYAGHQFGGFTMLGDGRAILLGEQRTPSGDLVDIQFKGSGQTAYSRRGDGRAALGPMLREYIISEAMHGLGIPTTRSLAVILTGDPVYRETIQRGAVLTRTAASHIRVGTFQYAAALQRPEALKALADYAIQRHDPDVASADQPYLAFLRRVIERQAELIARWQMVGFIHGVMNTDNVSICGETIDYGPCAFMDKYHYETVFSSIDHGGRYAYGQQPLIGQWNLARFAETLIPLIHDVQDTAIEMAMELLQQYPDLFEGHWLTGMGHKIGLSAATESDRPLIEDLMSWMQSTESDFTQTFTALTTGQHTELMQSDEQFRQWHKKWQRRIEEQQEPGEVRSARMRSVNPFLIPRNHRVEAALVSADTGDLDPLNHLVAGASDPYSDRQEFADLREPPPPDSCRYRTFCGT